MDMDVQSMFADMVSATGSSSGVYFTEGCYQVELQDIEYRPDGYKGQSVFFRFKVLTSNNEEHKPGATRVWILKLGKQRDADKRTMADIKSLIFALVGKSEREVGKPEQNPKAHEQAVQLFLAACDKEYAAKNNIKGDLLIGRKVSLECQNKTYEKKNGGGTGEFTRHVWAPAGE